MIIIYFFSFFLTFVLEFLIIFLLTKHDWKKLLLYVLLINLFTWPLANLAYHFGGNFYLIELNVILAEGLLLSLLLRKKYIYCLGLSFIANLVTALLSFLV
jgi:hypothetical protein